MCLKYCCFGLDWLVIYICFAWLYWLLIGFRGFWWNLIFRFEVVVNIDFVVLGGVCCSVVVLYFVDVCGFWIGLGLVGDYRLLTLFWCLLVMVILLDVV